MDFLILYPEEICNNLLRFRALDIERSGIRPCVRWPSLEMTFTLTSTLWLILFVLRGVRYLTFVKVKSEFFCACCFLCISSVNYAFILWKGAERMFLKGLYDQNYSGCPQCWLVRRRADTTFCQYLYFTIRQ